MNRFWKSGDPFVWLTGGALALSLIMVAGLVYLSSRTVSGSSGHPIFFA
jgi:ABC-type phosphate transport system auxiliary subunit